MPQMPDHAMSLATLIFASLAGVGSLIRVLQNERVWRRCHKRKLKRSEGREDGF